MENLAGTMKMRKKKTIRKEITDNIVMLLQKGDIDIESVFLKYNTKNVTVIYLTTKQKYLEIDAYCSHSVGNKPLSQGFSVVGVLDLPDFYSPTIVKFEGKFDTLLAQASKGGIEVVLIRKTKKEPEFLFNMSRENVRKNLL